MGAYNVLSVQPRLYRRRRRHRIDLNFTVVVSLVASS